MCTVCIVLLAVLLVKMRVSLMHRCCCPSCCLLCSGGICTVLLSPNVVSMLYLVWSL